MRTGLIMLCCLWQVINVAAQRKDSVVLNAVTVYGLPEEKFLAGSYIQQLDSSLKASWHSSHLGEILPLQLPIYFRNYGNGMLSGISMRGTSPQHTAVVWNGININSFSLGQADFSILPAAAFDDVKVHEGGGSARYGSGAFGGSVLLTSGSPQQNSFTVTQDAGSYGRYFTSLSGAVSTARWGFNTRVYNLSSKNNFLILSTNERQQHASFRQSGLLQDIEYKWSAAKRLSIHYWYHDANREIQPGIGQFNGQDNQKDRNHRLSLQFQNYTRIGLYSVYGGYVNDLIDFDGSKGTVARWIAGLRHEYSFANKIHTQLGAEWNHINGRIDDYQYGHAKEDRFDFKGSLQKDIGRSLSVALNLRQPVVPGFSAPFLPYLGADYFLIRKAKSELKLRGSISKNYRIPTLNDRYWQGVGNKDLLPETTRAGEAGISWKLKSLETSTTWFSQKVEQWIQWVPQDNGTYRPRNIRQVLAEGAELKVKLRYRLGRIWLLPQASYQYTRSVTVKAAPDQQYTINKQLIYTPQQTASAYMSIVCNKFSGSVSAQYNGRRFTDSGNSDAYALPAFAIVNLTAGKFWLVDQHRVDLQLAVKNLFNLDYQLYSGYALPGRNYNLQLTFQLNSKHD